VEPFHLGSDGLLRLAAWEKRWPGLAVGMTTRDLGNMAFRPDERVHDVTERREKLAERLGFSFAGFTFAQQVHGTGVQVVDGSQRGRGMRDAGHAIPETDGLSTGLKETVLSLFFADCVPIYFFAPNRGVIALAHAGWRGSTQNMAARMLEHFRKVWLIQPDGVWVAIGPSIGGCCYQVDAPVVDAVQRVLPDGTEEVCCPQGEGKWLLDLKALNRRLLVRAGVPPSHISVSQYCTACRTDLFYSYRKEGPKAGRMLAWIGQKEGDGR